jgi:hypothetical protein
MLRDNLGYVFDAALTPLTIDAGAIRGAKHLLSECRPS